MKKNFLILIFLFTMTGIYANSSSTVNTCMDYAYDSVLAEQDAYGEWASLDDFNEAYDFYFYGCVHSSTSKTEMMEPIFL